MDLVASFLCFSLLLMLINCIRNPTEGTTQVKETNTSMLLHEYELFTMRDDERIYTMLDRITKITNGLASFERPISSSNKVKKILRSLPKECDANMTTILKSKDLYSSKFSALVGSLINYKIVLKSRYGRAKYGKALKVPLIFKKRGVKERQV